MFYDFCMASKRYLHFVNDHIYHVFNRGVERRPLFTTKSEYERFNMLLDYYRFKEAPLSFSHYLLLSTTDRDSYMKKLKNTPVAIDILSYCIMPNHFHLIVRQRCEDAITQTIANITNSYAKYFNIKHHRVGPLFQGPFKAVYVETDEQLLHLSRYVHINPVVSGVMTQTELVSSPRTSFPDYFRPPGLDAVSIVDVKPVLSNFASSEAYKTFVFDQIGYGKELEKVKHLTFEEKD